MVHFEFPRGKFLEGNYLASGTLYLSFSLHNIETVFFYSEVQNIAISAFNAVIS